MYLLRINSRRSTISTYRTRDGRTITWSGQNICVCSRCDQVFNSVAAFDAHIRRPRNGKVAVHDYSWMPRNSAGRLVVSLKGPDNS